MLLGIKSKKILFLRHLLVGSLAITIVYLFWLTRPELSSDVRLWRALGDSTFSFLFIVLSIGPLAKLWGRAQGLVPWRREFGIWFAFLALTHFIRVFNYALAEPGIALPRLLGLIALAWALVLASTSSDRAVNFLTVSSWKWLHHGAYIIFYLASLHASYFLFMRYPEENWFRYPFSIMVFIVLLLQASAFIKVVTKQRGKDWY